MTTTTGKKMLNHRVVTDERTKTVIYIMNGPDVPVTNKLFWRKWEEKFLEISERYPYPPHDSILIRDKDSRGICSYVLGYTGWEKATVETLDEEGNWT